MLKTMYKKAEDELQIFWAEVYAPGYPDSQGDFMLAPDIRAMAYKFMKNSRLDKVDIQHNNLLYGCWIVESFIAREGDPVFIEGAWVVAIHVPDPAIWQLIKDGFFNGLSLEGLALSEETTLQMDIPAQISGKTEEAAGHVHKFTVSLSASGEFLGGETNTVDGHKHKIVSGTVTEEVEGHTHRFDYVEELLYVAGEDQG